MKFNRLYFAILLFVALVSTGCVQAEEAAPAEEETLIAEGEVALVEEEVAPTEEEEAEEEATEEAEVEEGLQAQLTPLEGAVLLRHSGEDEFVTITEPVWVGQGDFIRTGADGIAHVLFADNTEAVFFPNTQVQILTLEQDEEDDPLLVTLEQLIGSIFHRVELPIEGSEYEVRAPTGVASVRGTGFCTSVGYEMLGDLSPEEIENFITTEEFFADSFGSDTALFADLGITFFQVSCAGGEVLVTYLDENGEPLTYIPVPGEAITIAVEASEERFAPDLNLLWPDVLNVVIGIADRICGGWGCGDGVCDPYLGEDQAGADTHCAEDCAGG